MYILQEAFLDALSILHPDWNGSPTSFVTLCHPLKPLVFLTLVGTVISEMISLASGARNSLRSWTVLFLPISTFTHKGSLRGQ